MKNKKLLLFVASLFCCVVMRAQEIRLSADFTQGLNNFIIADVTKPTSSTPVWTQSNDYGMVASGFVSGKNYASDGWLISPTIDLQNLTHSRISISHAVNFFSSLDKAKEETEVCVRTVGGDWTKVDLCYPSKQSWNFIDCIDIDISAFDGQYIQIGFHYTSTSTKAGTWEIKSVVVMAERDISHITSLADLADLEDDSSVVIDFSEANAAMIDYSGIVEGTKTSAVSLGYTEAYIHDTTGAVMLRNFLPQDPGWHTNGGGALIGRIEGRYVVRNGVPGIEHTSFSKADDILCLDEIFEPEPVLLSIADALQKANNARYITIENVVLHDDGTKFFIGDSDHSIPIDNRYGVDDVDMDELIDGQTYNMTGVLGGWEDDEEFYSDNVLHLLAVETVTTGIGDMRNEELRINNRPTGIYDLQGRKIDGHQLRKGVYIYNGKKFVIK